MRTMSAIFVALIGTMGLAAPTASQAASFTFVQTSDHCTGGCGITANNFITVSDTVANTVGITAQLGTGWAFLKTGAGDATLAFSSTFNNLVLAVQTAGYGVHTPSPAGSLQLDGLFFPASAYGVDCTGCGPGASSPVGRVINFTVSLAGLTATTFVNALRLATGDNTTNSVFAADVLSPNGRTGIIDFSLSAVPLPPAMLLFGSALLGMGLLRRRRNTGAQAV
jgi:hypothetical protein